MPIIDKRLKHGFKNQIGQIIEKESGSQFYGRIDGWTGDVINIINNF